MADRRVLALDLGTSSVRALLFDGSGRAVPGALARRATALRVADDGTAELDPDAVVAKIGDCLDELAAQGALDGVTDVAISCAWHSVIATDRGGHPLTGALTWADTRAAGLVEEVRSRADVPRLQATTGALPHTTYWTVKLPWLARNVQPRPARYLGLAEYATRALTGEDRASVSLASGTGLLDLAAMTWDPEALALAGVDEAALPGLLEPGWRGRLRPALACRWPALAGAAWHPPSGDGAASNVGAGCVTPDRVAINLGTSAAVRAVHRAGEGGPLGPALWRYRVDQHRLVTGAAYSGGGNLYAWARKLLALPEDAQVEAALWQVPPGAEGVLVMPYHAGSRAPLDLAAGSGVIAGLSLATTPIEVLAAILEAVCFQLADGVEALAASLRRADVEVVASGGAIVASRWWQQTLANVLDRPVRVVDEPEASARGAALLALGLGGGDGAGLEGAATPAGGHLVAPDPAGVKAERAAREAHRRLAQRLGFHPPPGLGAGGGGC